MSIDTKWWKLAQISFSIFLCCAIYDVWVGFDDHLMTLKLLLTALFVIVIGQPIIVFTHNLKNKGKDK